MKLRYTANSNSFQMLCVINNNLTPSFNLAFEEELLMSDFVSSSPVFCLWQNHKSVIVGISQVVEDEVNLNYCNENGISVVRRRTGGGAVYHDLGNLNFSFFFPTKPMQNPYLHVFRILHPAFRSLGIEISLSNTNDLLLEGRKFSGMAERIIGDRLMVHGTILFDVDFESMTRSLMTDKSKFHKQRGVASRHAEVINLKGYLKDIETINDLKKSLKEFLSYNEESSEIIVSEEFICKVNNRARSEYVLIS